MQNVYRPEVTTCASKFWRDGLNRCRRCRTSTCQSRRVRLSNGLTDRLNSQFFIRRFLPRFM